MAQMAMTILKMAMMVRNFIKILKRVINSYLKARFYKKTTKQNNKKFL